MAKRKKEKKDGGMSQTEKAIRNKTATIKIIPAEGGEEVVLMMNGVNMGFFANYKDALTDAIHVVSFPNQYGFGD